MSEQPVLTPSQPKRSITQAVTEYLEKNNHSTTADVRAYLSKEGLTCAFSTVSVTVSKARQALNLKRDEPTISDLRYIKDFAKKAGGMKKLEGMVTQVTDLIGEVGSLDKVLQLIEFLK